MLLEFLQAARRRPSRTTAEFLHLGAFGLFLFAILDSSPIPTFGGADILTVLLVVTRPHPWYEYAAAATAGSVIGAYITFRLGRRAGKHYLESKLGSRWAPRFLRFFDRWGTAALITVTTIPFPLPTSLIFTAAGASNHYSTRKYLTVVALSRAARYSGVALIAHIYGRHIIRVLRHPAQNWHWLLLFGFIFVAVVSIGIIVGKRLAQRADEHRPLEVRV
jgi:membrane protein DedA with SNARE-associated domain